MTNRPTFPTILGASLIQEATPPASADCESRRVLLTSVSLRSRPSLGTDEAAAHGEVLLVISMLPLEPRHLEHGCYAPSEPRCNRRRDDVGSEIQRIVSEMSVPSRALGVTMSE